MSEFKFVCPCHFGLESVLSYEIKKIGGQNVSVSDGRVSFTGDETMIARANICLSVAERVLLVVGEFVATTFDELFEGTKRLPFEKFIGKNDAFPVKGSSINSKLFSVSDCQSIIKKATVEHLKKVYGIEWFEESAATYQIQFSLMKDNVTIALDTTGAGLHKRGYRRGSGNMAPIKETLAAGIVDLARVRDNSVVIDPFCGSGTLLVEAAYKALDVAPGVNRNFAAQNWTCLDDNSVWQSEKEAALSRVKKDALFSAFGSDIDETAIELTRLNSKKAGVSSKISASVADIANFKCDNDNAIIICNPPYGERLLELSEAEKLYKTMGEVFSKSKAKAYYIISPHEDFEKLFGRKADKRRKLYNGMIKCQLFMYFK